MRSLIIEFIYQRFDEDEDEDEGEDVYVENLIPGLPLRLQRVVKLHICLDGFMGLLLEVGVHGVEILE